MDFKRLVRRVKRNNTPEHALAQMALTFGGFVLMSQFSIIIATILLLAVIFFKNG